MVSTALLVVCVLSIALARSAAWENNYDENVSFNCLSGQTIYRVISQHSDHHEDRRWTYYCRKLPQGAFLRRCRWYNNVNHLNELLAFRCRGNSAIAGAKSQHSNRYEDRIFGYLCCEIVGKILTDCFMTSYINQYDNRMDYRAPTNNVIAGFISAHNRTFEDRRWKAIVCRVGQ